MKINLLNIFFIIFLLKTLSIFSQEKKLKGFVSDSLQNPLANATVLLKDSLSNYAYSITDKNGMYSVNLLTTSDVFFVEIRSIGYKTFTEELIIDKIKTLNVILKPQVEQLKEIFIESKRKINVNKDTVTYNISSFIDSTEETLEDVLKRLPGLEVSENGTIKFAGVEIEKILIEGEDLVSENYSLLSRNLDANLLENVQVLRNYNDNPLKKKFTTSNKVALNITIKEDKKNVFFGTLKLGAGTSELINSKNILGLLKSKVKILNLNNFNNNGYLTRLNKANLLNDNFNINFEESIEPILINEASKSFSSEIGFLKEEESVLNNTLDNTLTFSKKISKTLTARAVTTFSVDKINFNQFVVNQYNFRNNPISFIENKNGREIFRNFRNNIELKFYNNGNWYFSFESKVNKENNNWSENILTNSNLETRINNNLQNENLYFFNHFKVTYYPIKNFIWENYFYNTHSKSTETFFISSSRFNFETEEPINQKTYKELNYLGWKSNASYKKNQNKFEFETFIEKEKYHFTNNIQNTQNNNILFKTNIFQDNFNFGNRFTFTNETLTKRKLKVDFSTQLKNISENTNNFRELFFLPSLKINYSFNLAKVGNLNLSYNYRKDLLNTNYFFEGFVIKNYRLINNQIEKIETSNINTFGISHSNQSLDKGFLSFTVSSISFFDRGLTSNTVINNNFALNNLTFINRKSFLFFLQNETTQYFSGLKTSLKIKNNFTIFSNYISVNTSTLEQLNNYSFSTKLSGTTYLKIPLNFQFFLKYQKDWSYFQEQKSTVNNYILNLASNYKIDECWMASVNLNSYYLNNNSQNFLSSELNFKPNKGRFNYKLNVSNIFNENSFNIFQINEFQTFNSQSEIISRYIMLSVTIRF